MRFTALLCLSLFMAPAISTAGETDTKASVDKNIIVTLPPLSGLVAMLLPEIKSQCLLTANADPHHFQPSPKQVAMLNQEHLLIRASFDDQGWPIRVQDNQVVDLWPEHAHGWLEFALVRKALPRLAAALSKAYPQYQTSIAQHLAESLSLTTEIEGKWSAALETYKNKGVFIQHPSWLGLFQSKNVPVWEVLESHQHGHEHGPRHLEEALQTYRMHPDAALIGSKRHSNRSLEWLSRNQKVAANIIKLDAIDACNVPWSTLMSKNLKQLSAQ